MDALHNLSADTLSRAIHARTISCKEVMQATLRRVDSQNPQFNAIVSLAPEDVLLKQAESLDEMLKAGRSMGWLHGIPVAIKDLAHAVGFPTTLGSRAMASFFPAEDSLHVQRMKAAGAVVVGKTNTPEFGLGSNTYNAVFGSTGNAWNPEYTSGGSSGGAAVALARRMLWVADGSDFMGSLRNPAGWNHVIGLRPSQGRVPAWPKNDVWVSQLGTDGPMARNVTDLARLLDIQAGYDSRIPLSLAMESNSFVPLPGASVSGLRIGWLANLNGHLPMDPGILDTCESALRTLENGGAHVEPISLGMDPQIIWEAWLVWRQALVAPNVSAVLAQAGAREVTKPEALWEHDRAKTLKFETFMQASATRTRFLHQIGSLLEQFDVLALPTAQVWPFPRDLPWPRQINGQDMDTYHRWMEVTLYATFAGLPAISVPAGFDAERKLPMGLQLIGKPRGDRALIAAAAAYEALIPDLMSQSPPNC